MGAIVRLDNRRCRMFFLLDFLFGLDPLDAPTMTLLARAVPWWPVQFYRQHGATPCSSSQAKVTLKVVMEWMDPSRDYYSILAAGTTGQCTRPATSDHERCQPPSLPHMCSS